MYICDISFRKIWRGESILPGGFTSPSKVKAEQGECFDIQGVQ